MSINNKMVELVRNNSKFTKATQSFVSIYSKRSEYGGPEEGGWWHTVYALEGSIGFASREQAEAYFDEAEQLAHTLQMQESKQHRDAFVANHDDFADHEDDFCVGETCGPDEFMVIIEDQQGSMDNSRDPIPHWE